MTNRRDGSELDCSALFDGTVGAVWVLDTLLKQLLGAGSRLLNWEAQRAEADGLDCGWKPFESTSVTAANLLIGRERDDDRPKAISWAGRIVIIGAGDQGAIRNEYCRIWDRRVFRSRLGAGQGGSTFRFALTEKPGQYGVGLRVVEQYDHSRTFSTGRRIIEKASQCWQPTPVADAGVVSRYKVQRSHDDIWRL